MVEGATRVLQALSDVSLGWQGIVVIVIVALGLVSAPASQPASQPGSGCRGTAGARTPRAHAARA